MTKKILAILIMLASLIWLAVFYFPDDQLHLVFCDVGQGDAILIRKGFNQVLIDGGPDERVLQCLSDNLPFWDRTIEMIVLTHPQADHLTGLISVLERYRVQSAVVNNLVNDTERFWVFREALLAGEAEIYHPQAGERIKLADLDLAVLWPKERLGDALVWQREASESVLGASTYTGDLNETSVVLKLSYGDLDALLTGDIGQQTEKEIEAGDIEILKVAHHGSKYSTSEEFLEKVKPKLAVISVGKNRFGHPTGEVLERLLSVGAKILRTDQAGEIEIVSDGTKWQAPSLK
jgi:competence protein ComEC